MNRADYIIRGDYVIPMDDGIPVISDGAVAVTGNKITDTGAFSELSKKYKPDKVLGGSGRAVLPGLINTHTHAAMVLMRGMADDLPLKEWLEGHVWPAEAKWLSPEFIIDAVELACLEMLKAGITTYNDMYFYEDVSAVTARRMGIRAVLGAGIIDFPTKTGSSRDEHLKRAEEFIGDWKGHELITPCVAPHSAYACSPDTLKMAGRLAEKMGTMMHIHLSETKWEVEEVKRRHGGKTPGMLLEEMGLLSPMLLASHCVWLTDEEIEIFAKKGVGVSHCIESNLKLASGIAPVPKMIKAGIKVTFGTDGAASNNDLNILSEMSTAAKVHKAASGDPTALDAKTVLLMATRWAGEALGMKGIGCLKPGNPADLIVVDLRKPHLTPIYNIFSHIVYSMRPSDVETVMVNGKLLVEKGKLLTADEAEILDKAGRWAERISHKVSL